MNVFNLFFRTDCIPTELETAKIFQIYKEGSGDKHSLNNYRPISLLSSFSIQTKKIPSTQIEKFDIFYKHQFGFRSGNNRTHLLIHFLGKICDNLNTRDPVFTLLIFIEKAFDTCNIDILLIKHMTAFEVWQIFRLKSLAKKKKNKIGGISSIKHTNLLLK